MDAKDKEEINELVQRVGDGDEIAFEKLYNSMYNIIFCFLKTFRVENTIIEDVVAETFHTVIKKSKNRMVYNNCCAWIFQIAKFKMLNYLRKHKREAPLTEFYEDTDNSHETIFENFAIRALIESLTTEEQQIIYLKYCYGSTTKEISKSLHISESTVKRRLRCIEQTLKEKIENEEIG